MGFRELAALDADGSKGGIVLVWSTLFQTILTSVGTYCITIITKRDNFSMMITGVYGPQNEIKKISFLNELRNIRSLSDLPWVILGDFNIIISSTDTTGMNINLGSMLQFYRLISDMELLDIPHQGRLFTWQVEDLIQLFLN